METKLCGLFKNSTALIITGFRLITCRSLPSSRVSRAPFRLRIAVARGAVARRVSKVFGPLTIVSTYGSSETAGGPVCTDYLDTSQARLQTSGRPLPGVELTIADPQSGESKNPEDIGEIRIRGWCVMRRYLDDPDATARVIDTDGWYHTGDLGSVDAAGNLKFFSRTQDVVRVGGENVSATEIEQVLLSHPDVNEAYVVATPHRILGEVPVAFVCLAANSSLPGPDTLVGYCTTLLAKFKVPRQILVIESSQVPVVGPGKVNKRALAAWAATADPGPRRTVAVRPSRSRSSRSHG